MNSANKSATKQNNALLVPLVGTPTVHLMGQTGAAHIRLEYVGGKYLEIVLDNATREDLIFKLQGRK